MKFIYDIETYPNFYSFIAVDEHGDNTVQFEMSEWNNDVAAFFEWLDDRRRAGDYMVGFNNEGFDYPVIHGLLDVREKALRVKSGKTIADKAYRLAQEIIDSDNRFATTIYANRQYIRQIDLFKIHHFDNKARATSLKALEFNMRSDSIQELPFPPGTMLTYDQSRAVLSYNLHDVKETLKFYKHSLEQIAFREQLTEKYHRDFLNHNDTKIGKDYFVMKLEEEIPGICYSVDSKGKRHINQTKRDVIDVGSVLFDYYDFKRPEFIAVRNWFSEQKISETKGVFTDIKEHQLGEVAQYVSLIEKRQKKTEETAEQFVKETSPLAWIERVELASKKKGEKQYSTWVHWRCADTLNVVVDGFRFDFGTGGIHGSVVKSVVEADDEYEIVDADVASMYPNLAIVNRVYPEHLSSRFCDIYEDVYNQRKSFAKGTVENAMLKLALNGVYGDSNNKYSPFYDPAYTMAITINGQLTLCLLVDKLLEIEGLQIVQANTDGITVKLPKRQRALYDAICEAWQKQTGLTLEFVNYQKMFVDTVNAYIAVDVNGKIKRKGIYQYESLGWHQDHSALVIPKAAEAYMLHGKNIDRFVYEHEDIFDFMIRVKVPRSSKLVLIDKEGNETQQQNICRIYACKNGGKLVKLMPSLKEDDDADRNIGVLKDWNVKICNDMTDFAGDIDAAYYISEAKKLVIEK